MPHYHLKQIFMFSSPDHLTRFYVLIDPLPGGQAPPSVEVVSKTLYPFESKSIMKSEDGRRYWVRLPLLNDANDVNNFLQSIDFERLVEKVNDAYSESYGPRCLAGKLTDDGYQALREIWECLQKRKYCGHGRLVSADAFLDLKENEDLLVDLLDKCESLTDERLIQFAKETTLQLETQRGILVSGLADCLRKMIATRRLYFGS